MKLAQMKEIKAFEDSRGKISIVEAGSEIPFLIKRLFYIYDVSEGESRGNHANIKSNFFFMTLSGSCEIEVDNGREKNTYLLDNRKTGLLVSKMTWKLIRNCSKDCILLVLSDELFDVNEYISDYSVFKELCDCGKD